MSHTRDLRRAFVLANAFKEGDLAVGGTADAQLRAEAQRQVRALTLRDIRRTPFVDDGISAALARSRSQASDGELDSATIGQVTSFLLGPGASAWVERYRDGLTSEAIAAVAKVMSDDELSSVARSLFNPIADGEGVVLGAAPHFGSRIQPNSPGDDDDEILFSILEGLSYGCGDVIIGLNPAADELDEIVRLEELLERVVRRLALPTRYCVLSDMVKQHAAQRHTRVDVGFQSLAGTSGALTGMVGLDVDDLTDLAAAFDGLYFETGQGSAVTNGHAEGVDMVTLEARAYGVARHIQRRVADRRGKAPWMIVNDVAGFIGPEVFRHEAQLERACLEDIVMAKLHGLTMGLDVCATFHMGIAPDQLRRLTARIANRAAPAYLMAVAGNADPMLGYLTTSFREHPQLRQSSGRRIASVMDRRLGELSAASERTPSLERPAATAGLYAAYTKAGGDRRTELALQDDGRRRLHALRERGFDLGGMPASEAAARVEAIYTHARSALYACLDANVIRDASARSLWVRSQARDRDDYLAHPEGGERIPPHDRRSITDLYAGGAPQALIVVSDGLNANAVNEHLRTLLPVLRRQLAADGSVGETDIIVENGRVRAGYEIGELTAAEILIHLIGERPGTGLNCLSCYVTYGRDDGGRMRWNRRLDHSATNAICGIHPHGKPLDVAASEIARTVRRIREQRRSGVALNPSAAKARPRS